VVISRAFALASLLATACGPCPPWVDPDGTERRETGTNLCSIAAVESWGQAAWDGLSWELQPDDCWSGLSEESVPFAADGQGAVWPLERVGSCERWMPAGGFSPGSYTFGGFLDPSGPEPEVVPLFGGEEHLVEPWGRDPAFRAADVAGGTWQIDLAGAQDCLLGMDLMLVLAAERTPWLELGQPRDGSVPFRVLWSRDEDDDACRALQGEGRLLPSGLFYFAASDLVLGSEPPLQAWDLFLRAGFEPSGERAAGVELSLTVDLVNAPDAWKEVDDWRDLCEALLPSFGVQCSPCPEGDLESCLEVEYFATTAQRSERSFPDKLHPCFQEIGELPPPDCSFDPGCAATRSGRHGALLALFGLLLLVAKRRR